MRALYLKPELKAIELLEIYLYAPFTAVTDAYAKWNSDVVFNSVTYKSLVWSRSPLSWSTSSQDHRCTFQLDNVTKEFSQLIFSHEVSGGRLRLLEVYSDLLTDPASVLVKFDGSFSAPSADENSLRIDAISWLTRYGNILIPRRIYQRQCNFQLYDAACTIDRTAVANVQSSTTQANSTSLVLLDSNLLGLTTPLTATPNTYWDEGTVEFTSGANQGQARPLRQYRSASSEIEVRFPFLNTPAVGDAYSIRRGCHKTKDACGNRFNNLLNFGGFSEVPGQKQSLV